MESNNWQTQQERGSPVLIRLISWMTLSFGRPIGRILLYPITLYFLLFSKKSRTASRLYLQRVLGRKPGIGDIFHHIHTFAATILDRVFMLTGNFEDFEVTLHGEAELMEQYHRQKGCLMLGSHLGSFELLRSLATLEEGVVFRALMYEQNSEKISAAINAINPKILETIIPVGKSDSILRVKESMERGEVVGILGDRVSPDDKKVVNCNFFEQQCAFPTGPIMIGGLLNVPVIMFFGVYLGGRRYEIHFEVLSKGFNMDRSQREIQINKLTQQYVSRLEHYCRLYPYNWFNFYDYWNDNS